MPGSKNLNLSRLNVIEQYDNSMTTSASWEESASQEADLELTLLVDNLKIFMSFLQ